MVTNYYYWYRENPCPTCGRTDEALHIGKSSAGWSFALNVYPEEGIHDLPDWQERFQTGEIRDEYGVRVWPHEMLGIITARQRYARPWGRLQSKGWYEENNAVPGPDGLARHKVDGKFCIGHGDGSWDLIAREFS